MFQECDMALGGISLTYDRDQVVDYLMPYWPDKYAVTIKHTFNKWTYFTQIYTSGAWVVILIFPGISALIFMLVLTLINEEKFISLSKLMDYIFSFYGMLLMQGKFHIHQESIILIYHTKMHKYFCRQWYTH